MNDPAVDLALFEFFCCSISLKIELIRLPCMFDLLLFKSIFFMFASVAADCPFCYYLLFSLAVKSISIHLTECYGITGFDPTTIIPHSYVTLTLLCL